jgi:hypothetical protein
MFVPLCPPNTSKTPDETQRWKEDGGVTRVAFTGHHGAMRGSQRGRLKKIAAAMGIISRLQVPYEFVGASK